jgi:hypothetical protein
MKLSHRRQFLRRAAGAAALPAVARIAWAQAYPSRPVHIIVPFPAGQATDSIARLIGQSLSERDPEGLSNLARPARKLAGAFVGLSFPTNHHRGWRCAECGGEGHPDRARARGGCVHGHAALPQIVA